MCSSIPSPPAHPGFAALRLHGETLKLAVGTVEGMCRIAVYPYSRLPSGGCVGGLTAPLLRKHPAIGLFERGRLHLLRSGLLSGDTLTLMFDPGVLPVPMERVLANKELFIDHLAAGLQDGRSPFEVAGVQTNFFRLLSACTGIDEAELRASSTSTARTEP